MLYYLWSLVKEAEGAEHGEWFFIYYRYAANNIDRVLGTALRTKARETMYYGLLSILWAVDTVILGVALGMSPYVEVQLRRHLSTHSCTFFAAAVLLVMMAQKGGLRLPLE